MSGGDRSEALTDAVRAARESGAPVSILGGGTKHFYGESVEAVPLPVAGHAGVVAYEPTELVLTARSGTPLAEVEALLADNGQMLAFEPPGFGDGATLGGAVASGLSGPRRPWGGSVRDHVLGVRIVNGRGETGRFGGEVMKNVAGYDVSRLMVGALGTLGLILEVSLKVLPRPERDATVAFELDADGAVERFSELGRQPVPLSAAAWLDGRACVRLSGSAGGVGAALAEIGGETLPDEAADRFWSALREHALPFFDGPGTLWRIAVPPASGAIGVEGEWLIDWGGGQRWIRSEADAGAVRDAAAAAGGHATAFRDRTVGTPCFQPLPAPLLALHRRVKAALDPDGLFNPGRLVPGL